MTFSHCVYVDFIIQILNNHVTCYTAISHLSSDSKLYTISYHMYQFPKMELNINCGF